MQNYEIQFRDKTLWIWYGRR